MNRRNALTFLGLAGTASAALATENMVDMQKDGFAYGTDFMRTKVAEAMVRIADGIRSGEISVIDLAVNSTLKPDEWLTQTLIVNFTLNHPDAES